MVARTLLLCASALIACGKGENTGSRLPPDTAGVAPSPEPAASPATATCGDKFIGDEGIGKLSIAEYVDSVRANCRIIRDSTVLADEGMLARKITVSFGADTVVGEVQNGRVWRIEVNSPRFRSRDSLGVGTPLERLLALDDPGGIIGEGRLFVRSPDHCGLSFRLSNGFPGAVPRRIDRVQLAKLPRTTTVSQILIIGCNNE